MLQFRDIITLAAAFRCSDRCRTRTSTRNSRAWAQQRAPTRRWVHSDRLTACSRTRPGLAAVNKTEELVLRTVAALRAGSEAAAPIENSNIRNNMQLQRRYDLKAWLEGALNGFLCVCLVRLPGRPNALKQS